MRATRQLIGLVLVLGLAARPATCGDLKDLYFGEALYHAYQGQYFDALQRLDTELAQNVVLGEFGVEPLECIEILTLVCVVECLAEIEVLQVAARGRTGSKSQDQNESDELASRSHGLPIPKRDRSVAGTRSRQSQSDQPWLHFLAKSKLSRAAEVRAALKLAVDKHVQLVIPGRHVADVDSLHAALAQGLELFGAVDVVRHELAVDLKPHGIEAHRVALGDLDEDRDLCS